jgi:hypothetical protein
VKTDPSVPDKKLANDHKDKVKGLHRGMNPLGGFILASSGKPIS